jgi:hypothetical protein
LERLVSDIEIVPVHGPELRYAVHHLFDFFGMDMPLADQTYGSLDEAEHAAAGIMAAVSGSSD